MTPQLLYLILFICIFNYSQASTCPKRECFPRSFRFGVATSAYQIEGAWNKDGRGQSIWDHLIHTNPDYVNDGSNADIACNSYHKTFLDVSYLKKLGVSSYRFSLSWSRLLPSGLPNEVNEKGVAYYKELISILKLVGIEPMVTLHHWDLPLGLNTIGGWLNNKIVDYFGEYARLAFELFGEDVKVWSTFNEPLTLCVNHFRVLVNDTNLMGIGQYLCGHNIIKSHARAYHIYNNEFRKKQRGKIGIVLNMEWLEPTKNTTDDIEATERAKDFSAGWFANPIFLGDYPKRMKEMVLERSIKEGFKRSRLPEFSQEEVEYIKGTHDYYGLNQYTSSLISNLEVPIGSPDFAKDVGALPSKDPKWPDSGANWLKVEPVGLRKSINWIWKKYKPQEIIITENGYADRGEINDIGRINYHKLYLQNVLDAIQIDKVKVTGYMAWSFMDNFEWQDGYSVKFGFYHVDFNDTRRRRTPKQSAHYYRNVCITKCL